MRHERLRITPTESRKLRKLARMLADGRTYAEVEQSLGCSSPYVTRWRRRFSESRMRWLYSRYAGGRPRVRTAALEARILDKTRSKPADGSAHWSTRKLAAEAAVVASRRSRTLSKSCTSTGTTERSRAGPRCGAPTRATRSRSAAPRLQPAFGRARRRTRAPPVGAGGTVMPITTMRQLPSREA